MNEELVEKIESNPKYKELVSKRNSLGIKLGIFVLVMFYAYILVISFITTLIYVNKANGEFENLTNVDFLQCRLEKLEILKKDLRFPLILKEIKGDDEKSYKALVILNEDLYKYGNGILPMENYLKGMLMYKDYFCPKYFNGAWIVKLSAPL